MIGKAVTTYIDELVSVIMPTHNSERLVSESVASVINQTYQKWELIIVDDASSDNTVNVLKKLKHEDNRISVSINSENSGAAVTRNTALKLAKGQYIAFLDSDDLWDLDKLTKQIKFMRDVNSPFSFTAYRIINEYGQEVGKTVDTRCKGHVGYTDMLAKRATLGCSTVIIDRKVIGDIEMPLLRTGQDYALWLKILKKGSTATCLKDILTRYRIVPNSISRNKYKKAKRQWEIYRSVEKLNLVGSTWYFMNYVWRAMFRV